MVAFKILESGMKTLVSYLHVSCVVGWFLIQFNAVNVQIWYARLALILIILIKKGLAMMKNHINVTNDVDLKNFNSNHLSRISKY